MQCCLFWTSLSMTGALRAGLLWAGTLHGMDSVVTKAQNISVAEKARIFAPLDEEQKAVLQNRDQSQSHVTYLHVVLRRKPGRILGRGCKSPSYWEQLQRILFKKDHDFMRVVNIIPTSYMRASLIPLGKQSTKSVRIFRAGTERGRLKTFWRALEVSVDCDPAFDVFSGLLPPSTLTLRLHPGNPPFGLIPLAFYNANKFINGIDLLVSVAQGMEFSAPCSFMLTG